MRTLPAARRQDDDDNASVAGSIAVFTPGPSRTFRPSARTQAKERLAALARRYASYSSAGLGTDDSWGVQIAGWIYDQSLSIRWGTDKLTREFLARVGLGKHLPAVEVLSRVRLFLLAAQQAVSTIQIISDVRAGNARLMEGDAAGLLLGVTIDKTAERYQAYDEERVHAREHLAFMDPFHEELINPALDLFEAEPDLTLAEADRKMAAAHGTRVSDRVRREMVRVIVLAYRTVGRLIIAHGRQDVLSRGPGRFFIADPIICARWARRSLEEDTLIVPPPVLPVPSPTSVPSPRSSGQGAGH